MIYEEIRPVDMTYQLLRVLRASRTAPPKGTLLEFPKYLISLPHSPQMIQTAKIKMGDLSNKLVQVHIVLSLSLSLIVLTSSRVRQTKDVQRTFINFVVLNSHWQ
jgi:hypothetical protein